MITAKAVLNSKLETGVDENRQVVLTFAADYADGKNKEWSRFTPSLAVSMTVKGEIADRFCIGKGYTLQFVEEEVDGNSAS